LLNIVRKGAVAIMALAASAAALPASAAPCYSDKELQAHRVRQVQAEFMVAALQCRGTHPQVVSKYNSFVKKFGGNLNESAKTMRARIARVDGGRGAFDAYITNLANEASMRTMYIASYCDTVEPVMDEALAQKPKELPRYVAGRMAKDEPIMMCASATPAAAAAPKAAAAKAEPKKAEPAKASTSKTAPAKTAAK